MSQFLLIETSEGVEKREGAGGRWLSRVEVGTHPRFLLKFQDGTLENYLILMISFDCVS